MIGRDFILAGKAIFTVSNDKGDRYTFKVIHKKGNERWAPVWFIALLTGPNNEDDYTYMGKVDPELGTVILTNKSAYPEEALPVKVANFALRIMWGRQELPAGYAIHHEGKCGRCGRTLTVPESVDSGFGPECITKVRGGGARICVEV